MITTTELQRHVNAGAELLDATWPEWADEIDVPTLDLANPNSCVLGQVCDTYAQGIADLATEVGFDPADYAWRAAYGYTLANSLVQTPQGRTVNGWELLTVLWSAQIDERRV